MSQETEYSNSAMHFVDPSQQYYRSYSRNHQRSQELEAVEELAFQDVGTEVLVEQPVEEQSVESADLLADMSVLPVYQELDKDRSYQRIELCNLQEHLDQSKSFHRSCAHC